MSELVPQIEGEIAEKKPRKPRANGKALAVAGEAPVPADAPLSEGEALMRVIAQAASNPSCDIDKMERLFQMRERMQARDAESAFNSAMAACQAELIPVARNLKNKQTGSNYADLAAIAKEAMPVIHKHGFGITFSEFQSAKPDHLGIAGTVRHAAGHSERHEFNIPAAGAGLRGNANMTPTHAYASTTTYGRRYAQCCIFNIATEDDDGNGGPQRQRPTERITEQQAKDLETSAKRANIDHQIIREHFKVEAFADLTPDQFKVAMGRINKKLNLEGAA